MVVLDFKLPPEQLDQVLGVQVVRIERELLQAAQKCLPKGNHLTWGQALHQGNQTWVGLHPETIQTPYSELTEVCQHLDLAQNSLVVDLGAGY